MNDRSSSRSRRRNRSGSRGGDPAGGKPQPHAAPGQRRPPPKVDLAEFWGDPDRLPDRIDGLHHSPDVRAVLTSLGRPPLTGNETAAEHWFSMVYERAAFLAGALAAAGGLDEDVDAP